MQPASPFPMLQTALGLGKQPPGFQGGADGFPLANAEAGNGVEGCK